jgi:N6-adenosine-specific RNA methylase IME4
VPLEVTADGCVLDGQARLQVARELGLAELPVRRVDPADPLEHMYRAALLRRQLTPSQKAAIGVKLAELETLRAEAAQRKRANLRRGVGEESPTAADEHAAERASSPARDTDVAADGASLPARDPAGRVREQIAERSGASARTVQDALTVREHDPQQFERLLRGEVKASTAASKIRRGLRDSQLADSPPLPDGRFELILADPPWTFGSPDSEFSPEQHYPTLATSEIKALPVPGAAADDCLLFMWAVNCLLDDALQVLNAWGFTYRNNLVWVKTNGIGPGVWLRQRHELLLIASKGSLSPPPPDLRVDSVIEAPRTRHSEKPPVAYERIERMYPHLSKLELFARTTRPGWTSWGNQLPDNTQTPRDEEAA